MRAKAMGIIHIYLRSVYARACQLEFYCSYNNASNNRDNISQILHLRAHEADVDMDLNGDGDQNDTNVSNDWDGDGLPTWFQAAKPSTTNR